MVDEFGREINCWFGEWGIFGLGFAAGLGYRIGDGEVVGVWVDVGRNDVCVGKVDGFGCTNGVGLGYVGGGVVDI